MGRSSSLNLVMIAKDEERCIGRCLKSVRELVDEIIVVDTGSKDRTREIALSFGAKVYDFEWRGDFSVAKNYALSKSGSQWNLVLDADEYLTQGCRSDIETFMENHHTIGAVQLRSAFRDVDGINYSIAYIGRLLPCSVRYIGKIHEQVDSTFPRYPLKLIVDHDGYMQDGKGERNLELLLEALKSHPQDEYYLYQTAATLYNMKRFQQAHTYFELFLNKPFGGINYQVRGRILALYNLTELGLFDLGIELIEKQGNVLDHYADWHFACGIFYMKLVLSNPEKYIQFLPGIETSYLKCLQIGELAVHEGTVGNGSFRAAYNLGTWYEVSGDSEKAVRYYEQSAAEGYEPAVGRLQAIHCR